jgi:hypothetical protein
MEISEFLNSKETYNKVLEILSEKTGVSPTELASRIKKEKTDDETWSGEILIDGFIAGGSVANILNYLAHGVEPVIRDIDIFYPYTREANIVKNVDGELYDKAYVQDGWVESEMEDFRQAFNTELTIDGDWYGNKWVQPNGDFCLMKSHFRDGIANYVEVHVGSRNVGTNRKMIILKGFDINSCQVGLDLNEKKIVYTDEFCEFLKSRQMKVTIPVNPFQTTIRLHRKIEDMEAYCDFENEVKLLQYVTLCNQNIANRFGSETYEKYLENKDLIDKYYQVIKIEKPIKGKEDPFTHSSYIPSFHIEGKELWVFVPKIKDYELKYFFNEPLALMNYWRTMVEDTISKPKQRKLQKIMDKIYEKGIVKDVNRGGLRNHEWVVKNGENVSETRLSQAFNSNLMIKYENHGIKLLNYIGNTVVHSIQHWVWYNLLVFKNYYDCDFHPKHIDYITEFMDEHRSLRWLFDTKSHKSKQSITLQYHYEMIRKIKSIANKRGDWVIGELENLSFENRTELLNSDNFKEWIEDYLSEREIELSKPLIEPLDLTGFEDIDCVTELITTKDLRSEGTRMGHCVGGYSSAIEGGRSRIFHIECDGIGSTLEVGVISDSIWSNFEFDLGDMRSISDTWKEHIDPHKLRKLQRLDRQLENVRVQRKQHYGRYPEKGNLTPTEKNKEIAEKLVEFISKNSSFMEDMLKDILYKRHLLEMEIRKEVWDWKQEELKTNPNGTITVETFDNADQHEFYIPARRNVPVDELF